MSRASLVLEMARDAGFDLAALAPLRPPQDAERLRTWVAEGRHGDMSWFERQLDRLLDPRLIRPEAQSLLVVGLGHSRPAPELPGGGRIARYAAGRDYHNLMGKKLAKLGRRLAAEGFGERLRAIVDAGPLMERSHAAEAGLGFASKAGNLLHPTFGPWFFLGELLLEVPYEELVSGPPSPPPGSCGTCTACLDACPTGAIVEPGVVHAPLCISYQTIEQRQTIPRELRAASGPWAFGCDVCSEVCPWGKDAPDLAERFGTHETLREDSPPTLIRFLVGEDLGKDFHGVLNGSPLQRPKREGLARNAAIALGNLAAENSDEAGRDALRQALTCDASPLVREAAGWGLARASLQTSTDERARDVRDLERAIRAEQDEPTRLELKQTLAELCGDAPVRE